MEVQEKEIQDYVIAIRKRTKGIFAIFSIVVFLTVLIAFLLPSIYLSKSTILIEQQEIPQELVMSTVTSYASERIQTIQARVMTRTNLLRIVEKFELYEDERKVETKEEIVQLMRDDVSLDIISAEVVDPRTGRPSAATIAFSLSYKGESPESVQRVTNELTSLYLNENLTSRADKASETSVFFEEESKRLSEKIDDLESKLAIFKQEHADALPELQQLNLSVLQRKESELTSIDSQLRVLDEKSFYLGGQLAQIDPGNPAAPGSAEMLKALQAQYASIKSKYSDEHPDVVSLKNTIESLESEAGKVDNAEAVAEQLTLLNSELAQKKEKYTSDHPDVINLQEKIAVLNNELEGIKDRPEVDYYSAQPDNPLYITIETQLAGVNSEIQSIKTVRAETLKRIQELEQSLYSAPQVEREYLILKRDYENSIRRYQETRAKQMQADVAMQLESENKGEKFTLIEPAALPEEPVSPNRPAIIFLGVVLAIGGSLGFAIVADAISGTVRGAKGIQNLLGVLPLAVVPYEMNLADRVKTRKIKKRVVVLFVLVILLALVVIHVFVSPLDVLWFRILRKIEILMA